jgi:hypothetical protein
MIERIAEAVKKALLPELEKLSARMDRMEGRLEELSHRLGDLNDQLIAMRTEPSARMIRRMRGFRRTRGLIRCIAI